MPVEFSIDEDKKLYRCRFYESISSEEIYAFWVELYESNRRPEGYLEFLDLQDLTEATVTPSGMKRVAEYRNEQHRLLGTKQKYLIYAPSALSFGLCRMYHSYSNTSPEDVTFAQTLAEVENYLQIHSSEQSRQSKAK